MCLDSIRMLFVFVCFSNCLSSVWCFFIGCFLMFCFFYFSKLQVINIIGVFFRIFLVIFLCLIWVCKLLKVRGCLFLQGRIFLLIMVLLGRILVRGWYFGNLFVISFFFFDQMKSFFFLMMSCLWMLFYLCLVIQFFGRFRFFGLFFRV